MHLTDPYVRQAQARGYRSRAAFKLLGIHEKDPLIKPGMTVVDLGSAPGSWSQVFREESVSKDLSDRLGGEKVDVVISDMAPNLSGVESADAARVMHVCELALEFALSHLKPEGALLVKTFNGSGYSQLVELFKRHFVLVSPRKPPASRAQSSETFLLGRRLKPQK
jgi:23S rRNA (uridine2552-2'-O)-methyltransferase